MAYTLSSIVSSVQKRVKDTSYDSTEIIEYINDTQNDIFNEYRLNFMEKTQDYTTVANVADITNGIGLPTDYLVAIDLLNITNNYNILIEFMDVPSLDALFTNPSDTFQLTTTNNTLYWYKYAGVINLYPTPTISYNIRLRYYKMPTLLAADADVPALPSSFREILVLGAAYRVLQVKDNYDQAAILQNKYDEILQKLVSNTAVQQVGKSPRQRINRYGVAKRNF